MLLCKLEKETEMLIVLNVQSQLKNSIIQLLFIMNPFMVLGCWAWCQRC